MTPAEHAATVRGLRNLTSGYSYGYACDYYLREHGLNLIDEYERLAQRATELERERDQARQEWHHLNGKLRAERERAEQLETALRTSYPMTPVDCLLSELRDGYGPGDTHSLLTRSQFEERVAQFNDEVARAALGETAP